VPGATSYEVVVVEVEEGDAAGTGTRAVEGIANDMPPALWSEIPGAALSWTPDSDGAGEASDFTVVNKDGQIVFNVHHDGTTFIEGDLLINGDPAGNLVSLDDVDQLIQSHRVAEHPKIVFVTSQTYTGNLGGHTGADQKCKALALAAGLLGNFKAWISGDGLNEEARATP
jgi:hypothetical protein